MLRKILKMKGDDSLSTLFFYLELKENKLFEYIFHFELGISELRVHTIDTEARLERLKRFIEPIANPAQYLTDPSEEVRQWFKERLSSIS